MFSRRMFLGAVGAAGAGTIGIPQGWATQSASAPRRKLAVVTTEWRFQSHAWHMAERFLVGYPIEGNWHRPAIDVVAAYVDQFPEKDLSRQRAAEFGFPIYPSIAEALRCGGDKLALDLLRTYLGAEFSTEEHFRRRVRKLAQMEQDAAAELNT